MMQNLLNLLTDVPCKYRPVPFWSWNAKLETDETQRQIQLMNDKGIGGFFMHARSGLNTPYLEGEWIDNVKAAIEMADELCMDAWGYDENGFPSGTGSDKVNALGVEYQQKILKYEFTDIPVHKDNTVTNNTYNGKNVHFYYEINQFYVDTLNPLTAEEFIKSTHEVYKEKLGEDFKKLKGFFTDEPQVSRIGMPWSFVLCDEYEKAYGEDLLSKLCDLFFDTENGNVTRFRFWKLVTYLFSEGFMKKIYDWCNANNTSLTGHMVLEETLPLQLETNGSVMACYEYFHIPGVDMLGRDLPRDLLAIQPFSVAAQTGKKQVLTESFACCGWDLNFEEMKHILEYQMVKGVNLLCQHLAPYSFEGVRKRDYPPFHFFQNPWWDDYNDFCNFASRMGLLLSEGNVVCDVLVLHNISSGWVNWFGDDKTEKVQKINDRLVDVLTQLDKNRIPYHLGDDKIMSKYAGIQNDKFVVGKMQYSLVIVPPCSCIDSNTLNLLEQFSQNGGKVVFVKEVPFLVDGKTSDRAKDLCKYFAQEDEDVLRFIPDDLRPCSFADVNGNNPDIQLAYREFEDFRMYYFVNTYAPKTKTTISFKGKSVCMFDYLSVKTKEIEFDRKDGCVTTEYTFEEKGSCVFFVRDDEFFKSKKADNTPTSSINQLLQGEWVIKKSDSNVLTFDKCDVYFNGELKQKNIYVNDIQQLACDEGKKVSVAMDFDVNFNYKPDTKLTLVVEKLEKYKVYVNGKVVQNKDEGYYRDKSLRCLDVTGLFDKGYNIITLECDFEQSQEVYDIVKKSEQSGFFMTKLRYDFEIEPIYLLGDFGVYSTQEFTDDGNDGCKTYGTFILDKPVKAVKDGDVTRQGFAFFCGNMTLEKTFNLNVGEEEERVLELLKLCSVVTKITVNGKKLPSLYWAPYSRNLDGYLKSGENTIEIEFSTSFRNMLGPHHLGMNRKVAWPFAYFNNSRLWKHPVVQEWWEEESYSFVNIGVFLK